MSDRGFKLTKLRHRNNSIRATFGIKRNGSYDWAIAEISNQLRLSDHDLIPSTYCYGYKKNALGFITSVALVTEYIGSTYNALEYLEAFPEKRTTCSNAHLMLF